MKIKKLTILLGCCFMLVFTVVFGVCKRDNVKASILTGSIILEAPSFQTLSLDNSYTASVSPSYIALNTVDNSLTLYLLGASDNTPYYTAFPITIGTPISDVPIFSKISYNEANETYTNIYSPIGNSGSINVMIKSDIDYTALFTSLSYVDVTLETNSLRYTYYNSSHEVLFTLLFENLSNPLNLFVKRYNCNIFISNTSNIDQQLLDLYYNNGYGNGFTNGYNKGYYKGVEDGSSVDTPLAFLTNSVNSFFNIKFFGDFGVDTLLYIVFGTVIIGIIIKIFLGG